MDHYDGLNPIMDVTPSTSVRQRLASNALASVASFSKKHLVPPTPGSSSVSPPQHHVAGGRFISQDVQPSRNSTQDTALLRFANFKRLVSKHNGVPRCHTRPRRVRTTYLSTPEEDRGHSGPSSHDVNPPTIQQIASGLATRPGGLKPIRTSPSNQPSSSTASISSTNSSMSPAPLKSSLKKASNGTSSLSSSIRSSSSPSASHPSPLSIASKPFEGVRNLFQHKHPPTKFQKPGELYVMDDGGSLISEQSSTTRRMVGRVRFSDDEDETGFETITIRERRRYGLHDDPSNQLTSINGNGNGVDSPNAKLTGLASTPSSPGVLSGARKNVMKMFHRTTPSSSSP